jgi:hypothetical protein
MDYPQRAFDLTNRSYVSLKVHPKTNEAILLDSTTMSLWRVDESGKEILLAGGGERVTGRRERVDGTLNDARFRNPSRFAIVEDSIYVVDGSYLRCVDVAADRVTSIKLPERCFGIAAWKGVLYVTREDAACIYQLPDRNADRESYKKRELKIIRLHEDPQELAVFENEIVCNNFDRSRLYQLECDHEVAGNCEHEVKVGCTELTGTGNAWCPTFDGLHRVFYLDRDRNEIRRTSCQSPIVSLGYYRPMAMGINKDGHIVVLLMKSGAVKASDGANYQLRIIEVPLRPCREKQTVELFTTTRLRDAADKFFVVEDQEIPVHSSLLIETSDYFKTMLKSGFREETDFLIKIEDASAKIVSAMVQFLYIGTFGKLNFQETLALYSLADKYNLQDLANIAQIEILTKMTPENVRYALLHGYAYSFKWLIHEAIHFIGTKATEVSFTDLDSSLSELSLEQKSEVYHALAKMFHDRLNEHDDDCIHKRRKTVCHEEDGSESDDY